MKCETAKELIVDDLTGDLSADQAEELRVHLDTCEQCGAEAQRLRATWSDLGELTVPEPGPAGVAGLTRQLAGRGNRQRSPFNRTRLAVAAFVMLALLAGYQTGRITREPVQPDFTARSEYLLLLWEPAQVLGGPAIPSEPALFEEYTAWADLLAGQGRLVGAEKLTDDPAVWLAGVAANRSGPDPGAWPNIGGYFVITAADLDSAIELARQSPHLKYGGAIEVRLIDQH